MDMYNKSPQEYFAHHGVKGMRWGVRRYQNYDGSYTQRGLKRYRAADRAHEDAKQKAKAVKQAYKNGTATKDQYKTAKGEVKVTKRALNKSYDKLKTDKLADEGKKLYQRGKTITSNTRTTQLAEAGIVAGSSIVTYLLSNTMKDARVAYLTGTSIAVGGSIVNAILAGRTSSENKKLRAYYAH